MEKLNFLGAGPKIGKIVLPWFVASVIISIVFKQPFEFPTILNKYLFIIGIILIILGFLFYFTTIPFLLKGLKEIRLVKNGGFFLCCNPLYASIILLIFPGTSLLLNSWLILTTSIVGFIVFKMNIDAEYIEMEKFFGEEYLQYRHNTPEFFPFPVKKLLSLIKK